MSGAWRKTLAYLGLADEPDELDELPEAFGREPATESVGIPTSSVPPGSPHVRAVQPEASRVSVLRLRAFDEVETAGKQFVGGQAVLLDLADAEADIARRILDFLSGLVFATHGRMSRVDGRAYLLMPSDAQITSDDQQRLRDLGYPVAT